MTKKLTAFQLKVIGIILMVFDHVHQMFYFKGIPIWFSMLGRLVAPIFLFLSAEGFHYTRNKLAYIRNLLVGFWIMGVIDLALPMALPHEPVTLINNIFGTLLLGVLTMYCYDGFRNWRQNKKQGWIAVGVLALIFGYTAFFMQLFNNIEHLNINVFRFFTILFPTLLTNEGGPTLVLLALFFYIFREKRTFQIVTLLVFSLISTGFNFTGLFSSNIQWMSAFTAILIALYSGKEGKKMKWFFYYFYPIHIVILYVLSALLA